MAQALATSLATEAVKGLTKLVAERAFEKISLTFWQFDDKLEKLKNKLQIIEAFLITISTWNIQDYERNTLADPWLQKVKNVAYLADEVMDDYALEIIRKTKLDTFRRAKGKINNLKDKPLGFRFDTSGRVAYILSKIEELDKEARSMGLIPVELAKEAISSNYFDNGDNYNGSLNQVRKHAYASASQFVGRKFDAKKLLGMICKPKAKGSDLSTIAIFGIGGLGKTTLARLLYEHKEVDRHFDKKKVWICVSNNFNVERLLKEMVESLTQEKCDLSNTEAITRKLQSVLKGKKFLLVLDDVWNNNQQLWDSFRAVLQRVDYVAGSTIFVTTRIREVAEKSRAVYVHELKGLSRDESWDLFIKELASDKTILNVHSFKDVGRKIVEKCKGVPLEIKVIASVLQSRMYINHWEAVEKNEVWNLLRESNEHQILPSLLLSFSHLQLPEIKQCFAYCAIFPKGTSMKKDQLIALWLSQGFLQEPKRASTLTLEEVGETYIQALLNNSVLQEERDHDTTISYKMHDLVHDLASYILKDDLFVLKEGTHLNSAVNYRHLIYYFSRDNEMDLENYQKKESMFKNLRTASFRNCVPRWDLLILAKYIRTLIMVNNGLTEVSPDIEKLKHLRYLDLSENLFQTLPESICELYQLQTLRILHCSKLTKLPKNLHKLINLRHLLTSNFMHVSKRSLQQLTTLQTLPKLELRDGKGWTIDELGHLPAIKGEVCISRLEHIKSVEQARKADLTSKDKISKLDLTWGNCIGESSNGAKYNVGGVLYELEPHPNIRSINIRDYSDVRFPSWLMTMSVKQGAKNQTQLSNLTVVEFQRCRKLQRLPTLGELPSLSNLKLEEFDDVECIESEFYQTRGHAKKVLFPALKHLRIKQFPKLTKWMSPPSSLVAFTCLETLEIRGCRHLKTVPTLNYKSLRDVELEDIGSSQSLDIIKYSSALQSLQLTKIQKMTCLPQHLLNCTNLQILEIHGCEDLKSFPTDQQALESLKKLRISNCDLTSLPEDLFHGSLLELSIDSCTRLTKLPFTLEKCTSMQYMRVKNCPSIDAPVPNLCGLEGLSRLTMLNSGYMMASVLESIPYLHNLRELEIGGFSDNMECLEDFLEIVAPLSSESLIRLVLRDCPSATFLPKQLRHLTSIECLYIDSFALQELPEWIDSFSSLEELRIYSCQKLASLASKEVMLRLSQLKRLYVDDCPFLEKKYVEDLCDKHVRIRFDDDDLH